MIRPVDVIIINEIVTRTIITGRVCYNESGRNLPHLEFVIIWGFRTQILKTEMNDIQFNNVVKIIKNVFILNIIAV